MVTLVQAEVVLDGTLGPKGTLPGPNFLIDSRFGQQIGLNLFHSFETFNVNNTESAVFMGSTSIDNVISRVTGGQASLINGLFTSVIPGADTYHLSLLIAQNIKCNRNNRLNISVK